MNVLEPTWSPLQPLMSSYLQTHSVFGGQLDQPPDVTSCPLGAEGLACRQAEARRVIDNCPGGKQRLSRTVT
jgi:hypothetical protein